MHVRRDVQEQVHAPGAACLELRRQRLVRARLVAFHPEPVLADRVADFAGQVIASCLRSAAISCGPSPAEHSAPGRSGRTARRNRRCSSIRRRCRCSSSRPSPAARRPRLVEKCPIAAPQHAGNVDPRLGDRTELRQQLGDLRGLKVLIQRRGERRQIAARTWERRSFPAHAPPSEGVLLPKRWWLSQEQ